MADTIDLGRLKTIMVGRGLTLAVAESLTSGNIQARVGSVSGASNFFEGGITAYSIAQKVKFLGVDAAHAREVNAVSERVAAEMARGACLRFDCDLGIGTTGYAERYPERHVAEPFAHFAIWRREGRTEHGAVVVARRVPGTGLDRVAMQRLVADDTINALLAFLEREH